MKTVISISLLAILALASAHHGIPHREEERALICQNGVLSPVYCNCHQYMECVNNNLLGPYDCGQEYVFNPSRGKCEPMDDFNSSLCDVEC